MKVDKMTGKIIDFEDIDKEKLLKSVRCAMYRGDFDEYFREVFEEWHKKYGVDCQQVLLVMSTLFPMRVLDSMID